MSSRGGGGARGGGRGRRGGRGGDFSAEPPPAEPFYVQHGGGRGGGGRGRRGGRGGDFSTEPPPAEPFYVQHGGGRGGGGRGRRGGRGDDLSAEPYPAEPFYVQPGGGRGGRGARGGNGSGRGAATPVPPSSSVPQQPPAPPAPVAQLAEDMKKMAIKQSTPGEASTSAATPSMVPKAAAKEVAPADPEPVAPPASSKAIRHPSRPGFGSEGQKCVVRANHFLVEVANRDLCHYDVAITPESTSRARNRSIISELVKLHKQSTLSNRIPAFDGRKSLYTAGALPFTSKDFVVKLADTDTDGKSRREKEFKVTIKLVSKPDLQHLQQFLHGRQLDVPQETIQALDVVMRESASTMHAVVARSFFSPEFGNSCYIGDGVECWRGYYQSLRPTQMGLSLNLDIAATSFYKAGPLVDFVFEYLNIRDPRRPLSDKDRIKLKRVLRGIRVEATHRREKCFRYKITGLSSVPMNQLKFPLDDQGEMVSVVQYFKQRYNCSLEYVSWPCLQAGNDSRPTYLPIEVCNLLEGQRYARKLNERQVTGILRATCQRPADRERSILEMVKRNNYNNDNYVKEFGIRVASQLVSVDARVLPPPKLKYHDSGKEKICCPGVGQWNMINKKMVDGGKVQNWTCLSFSSQIRRDEVIQFCNDLVRMCNSIGMEINPRPFIDIRTVRPDDIENALKKVHTQSDEGRQLQLLLVILPDMSGLYGRIKTVCETGLTGLGIVSQCCLPKNIYKGKQYLENVALKINVKVGGRNTVLEAALHGGIPFLTEMPTIIFGADVTHPAPGDDSLSSIAAVVGSMDWPEVTKYRGLVSAQQHRQEIISDLFSITHDPKKGIVYGGMIRELLISFLRATKRKPARIIFYRDGVSEGQFNQVLLNEMDAIRRACASLEEGYLPPVTFVVVQKRHHTRLFPEVHGKRELTDRSGNILAGTVVDTKICHPTEFDFYLCSHAGIQGTSRPTHYHVLYDENHFTADGLQMLTNNLCYTYARCTRSVSIVPPAYYAHLVAFRARYYMEDNSEAASSAGGGHQRDFPVEVRRLPNISNNVKDVMFYC